MTLIEMLAVVVVIALVTGVLLTNFAAMSEDARIDEALHRVLDLDRRARILARSGAACELSADETKAQIRLVDNAGNLFAAFEAHVGLTLEITDMTGQTLRAIQFDAIGRSIDYRISVRSAERCRTRVVYGLTGWSPPEVSQTEVRGGDL